MLVVFLFNLINTKQKEILHKKIKKSFHAVFFINFHYIVYMKCNEEILVENIRHGNRKAQRELYDTYAARLLSLTMRYVGNHDIAQDILQDVFIRIFDKIDRFSYRGEGSLRAWIERITVNSSLEWLRSNKKIETVSLNTQYSAHNPIDEPSSKQVELIPREVLMKFISELPDGYRVVFNMFCVEEYSHREIAEHLNINEKSSSSQLLRAKRLLAHRINEYIRKNE